MEEILIPIGKTGIDKFGFSGAIQQVQSEKKFLREYINHNPVNLYLEIGTLWGGTAIIAALAGAKQVITIDSMDGLRWHEPDPWYPDEMISKERILANFYAFGVEDIIHLVHAKSYPFPLDEIYPDVTLIDGAHDETVFKDWESVKDITRQAVLIHDYQSDHLPAVTRLVDEVAAVDPEWKLYGTVGCTAVLFRSSLEIKWEA